MNVTATLIGQMITFAVLVWFIQRYLWGPMTQMMEDRRKRIADGLAAAERGKHEQELAERRAKETIHEAKEKAAEIIAQANKQAVQIVEEAKEAARAEADRIKAAANAEMDQEINRAKQQLRGQVVNLSVAAAARVLKREIDAKSHEALIQDLVAQI